MTVFAIAFRTGDEGPARERRREGLAAAIRTASDGPCWGAPDGFAMIVSPLTAEDLADALVAASGFDGRRDSLLVVNLSVDKGSAFRGQLVDPDLLKLLALR